MLSQEQSEGYTLSLYLEVAGLLSTAFWIMHKEKFIWKIKSLFTEDFQWADHDLLSIFSYLNSFCDFFVSYLKSFTWSQFPMNILFSDAILKKMCGFFMSGKRSHMVLFLFFDWRSEQVLLVWIICKYMLEIPFLWIFVPKALNHTNFHVRKPRSDKSLDKVHLLKKTQKTKNGRYQRKLFVCAFSTPVLNF